jgi:hypothetical protein
MDLARLNKAIGYDKLSLEGKIRRAVRAAKMEMHPVWIASMRTISSARKLDGANELFLMARDALYFQERRKGLSDVDARRVTAQRLLKSNDW